MTKRSDSNRAATQANTPSDSKDTAPEDRSTSHSQAPAHTPPPPLGSDSKVKTPPDPEDTSPARTPNLPHRTSDSKDTTPQQPATPPVHPPPLDHRTSSHDTGGNSSKTPPTKEDKASTPPPANPPASHDTGGDSPALSHTTPANSRPTKTRAPKHTAKQHTTTATPTLPRTAPGQDTGADSSKTPQGTTPQDSATLPTSTPQMTNSPKTHDPGGDSPAATPLVASVIRAEPRSAASSRWTREGRDIEVGIFRDRARAEYSKAHKGSPKREAHDYAWEAAIAAFPPGGVGPESLSVPESPARGETGQIQGLAAIPSDWPVLPANTGLQVEIGWVQANRLLIVTEKPGGATRVDLARAVEPAPSRAALGWLETSIRAYSKYVDIVARAMATQADEQQQVGRERMAINAIRSLLDEMHTDVDG